MMSHPMLLHGHNFLVVPCGQSRFAGALRDTGPVPPKLAVTAAFDAGAPGSSVLRCHHMARLAAGMMTEPVVA